MKIALAVIVVSVSVWASGCCSAAGPGPMLAPEDGTASGALLAGGARAPYVVLTAGGTLPEGLTLESSDPGIVSVAAQPDHSGRAVVLTGKAGDATLNLYDVNHTLVDARSVSVRDAARLTARFADDQRVGHAIAGEVVGLRIRPEDADGVLLYGSGRVHASIGGTGGEAEGARVDGVERVFLIGKPGDATVHATLDGLSVDATVVFATPVVTAAKDKTVDLAGCNPAQLDCLPRLGAQVSIDVREDTSVALAGGKCTWSAVGAELVTDDPRVDGIELAAAPRTAVFVLGQGRGHASATCTLGGQASTVVLR